MSPAQDAVTNPMPSAIWAPTQLRTNLVAEGLQKRRVLVLLPELRREWLVTACPLLNICHLDAVNARRAAAVILAERILLAPKAPALSTAKQRRPLARQNANLL